ncbi:MAG: hypothetical protein DCC58_05520 [Chloroflexi bacterium]|nr:MAG: hypothetical protein DCC58_05520 [Chloroflexota bacterium]
MTAQEQLRSAIELQRARLQASVPADRRAAILGLLRAQALLPPSPPAEQRPNLITGRSLPNLGGNQALELCLAAAGQQHGHPDLAVWSAWFLQQCSLLAEAELVLGHVETGFMGIAHESSNTFDAWVATKRPPTSWRERADFDSWGAWYARQHPAPPSPEPVEQHDSHTTYAAALVRAMGHQLPYPADATIDGCSVRTYCALLAQLIALARDEHARGAPAQPRSERDLIERLAARLRLERQVAGRALAAFILDIENAGYHAAVPGVAAAPAVRLDERHIALSLYGLTTEPLLFLARELRRRNPQEYSNTAFQRETAFRRDLYALFQDKRFITSNSGIELRREAGSVRTDIDAVVFDRKTGTLAFFELKSQDPFARSTAELHRQRDNLLYANSQVAGVLAWLQRHGGDALLQRVDPRTAKTFRVHRVHPFVLGRYLAHFNDGPPPDKRAVWGTWPQLLRLLDAQPLRASDSSPLSSLFNRLSKDAPSITPLATAPPRDVRIGDVLITVHSSYAAFQHH